MTTERYNKTNTPEAPALKCFTVTPSDSTDQNPMPKSIRAFADGVIRIKALHSPNPVDHPVLAGERIDVFCERIYSTGTTGQTTIIGYA